MNSEQWSSIIRTLLALLIGPAGYLVTKGVLPADQAAQLMPAVVTILTLVVGAVIAKWGVASHSPAAVVAAVNSDSVPGVKVVSVLSASPQVSVDPSTGAVKPEPVAKGA